MNKNRFIAIKNQADSGTLELFFLDVIEDKFDWYTGLSSPVQEVIDKVNYYKPTRIKLIIDSVGGDAQKGLAIYNFLKRCDAKVEVEIIGLAGSIASVIAMAANKGKLRIAKNAFMMIHKAEGGVWGTSDEVRKHAELIDMYTGQIVDIYSQRTGKPVDAINALIENGDYWMTGEDCVTQGFADETFNDTPNLQIAARLDTSWYKNIPDQVRAQLKPESAETDRNFFTNQFNEMKKFFTDIANAIKGVKPVEGTPITNQIAEAVTAPFEKLADEIETTISNKVTEGLKPVNEGLPALVNTAVAAIDFAGEKPKAAIENAASASITNALKAEGDNDIKTAIKALLKTEVDAAIKPLQEENAALKLDITNMKGNKSQGNKEEVETPAPVGSFK